jgi:hypothetical protein
MDEVAQGDRPALHVSLPFHPFGRREQGLHQIGQPVAGIPKAVEHGASGPHHQVLPLKGLRDTLDDRERGSELVRHGGDDGGLPEGEIAFLVGQSKLSVRLAPKASGRGRDDAE